VLGSPYYWVLVGLLTAGFAISDLLALSRRELGRKQGAAIAVYVASWGIVAVLGLPIAPLGSLWWVFPAAIRVAFAVMIIGGELLAEAVRAEQAIEHRHDPKPPSYPEHHLTAEELRTAEQYEAEWRKHAAPPLE
jgi:hypothetical protein